MTTTYLRLWAVALLVSGERQTLRTSFISGT